MEAEDEESAAIEVGIERASEDLRIDTRDGVEGHRYDCFHDGGCAATSSMLQ